MRLKTVLLLTAAFLAPCSVFATPVPPSQITSIVSFGDSLSDAGNASIATGGADPGPGYATRSLPGGGSAGYYTNPQFAGGPSGLWVDQLAAKLGVADPAPSLAGGTNYAVGSALTGNANPQDMENQVGAFFLANPTGAPSSALYTFWGGANDLLANPTSAVTAADNIAGEIEAVAADGGQNFLWLNLPDLGGLPLLAGNPAAQAAADAASQAFDLEWASKVSALDALGINVIGVNVEALISDVNARPGAYGIANKTTACAITPNCDPNTALYWDLEHPTTQGHALVADAAFAAVAPIPEPSTFILVGTSALTLGGALRRRLARP